MPELSARRKADRAAMAARVAALATWYGLTASHKLEEPGTRCTSVDLAGPHGLKLTVKFDAGLVAPDTYLLSWHGVEDGTRLDPGVFGRVNEFHGHKATDVARGFAQLERVLTERFKVIRDGSAFVGGQHWTGETGREAAELFKTLSTAEIRRRQDLADQQLRLAGAQGNERATADLQHMQDALTAEMLRRTS
jgi:hypothetical protein